MKGQGDPEIILWVQLEFQDAPCKSKLLPKSWIGSREEKPLAPSDCSPGASRCMSEVKASSVGDWGEACSRPPLGAQGKAEKCRG